MARIRKNNPENIRKRAVFAISPAVVKRIIAIIVGCILEV
jgi:hypothetical protein